MRTDKGHKIRQIEQGSIAQKEGICAGDSLLSINGAVMEDIFDYQYQVQNDHLELVLLTKDGEEITKSIDKDEDDDLGIIFENGLMDQYRSCHNKCIFCFIDQMPKGMRENLYFKDDDSRLSFLQGNYVTLTNMSDHDLDRIIKYHLAPINVSFQTMNPELRCMMLHNRFAGDALKKVDRLYEAGITMNGQIVLCKGVNDGRELDYSIRKLMEYLPVIESVSVVPVGLSRFREGLYPLEPFTKEDAKEVIDMIHRYQQQCMEKYGTHFIHASDEWYLLAEEPVPEEECYEAKETMQELYHHKLLTKLKCHYEWKKKTRTISLATGKLAYPYIRQIAKEVEAYMPGLTAKVYEIRNDFFGERITVSGLITGTDLMNQLRNRELGEALLIPENMVRVEENVFLDDITVSEVEKTLQVPVDIVKSSGRDLIYQILGLPGMM